MTEWTIGPPCYDGTVDIFEDDNVVASRVGLSNAYKIQLVPEMLNMLKRIRSMNHDWTREELSKLITKAEAHYYDQ